MEFKQAAIEYKAGDEKAGAFTGYGSVFGNLDDGGDVIEAGAFKKIRKMKNGLVRILLAHDSSNIIGEAKVTQDEKGLWLDGNIYVGDDQIPDASRAYSLMKRGAFDALSVGFNILKGGSEWAEDYSHRIIKIAELWEVSVLSFGANRKAKVHSVKSAGAINSVRDLETHLKSIGYSRADATAIALHGYKGVQRDAVTPDSVMLELKKLIATRDITL